MTKDYTIASATCFYNDVKSLERTLESLKDKVDYMICVDGRFKHTKDDNPEGYSNDGSVELVASYPNAVYMARPNAYEIEKRQFYVDFCNGPDDRIDYLLIVDSDEYVLEYDKEVFERELTELPTSSFSSFNVFAVMLEVNSGKYSHIVDELAGTGNKPQTTTPDKRQFAHSPRLWHKPYEMEYNVRHYHFRNKDPSNSRHYQETNPAIKIIPGIKLGHDHVLRSQKHLNQRYQYQKWLVNFEQKILQDYEHKTRLTPQISEYDKLDIS